MAVGEILDWAIRLLVGLGLPSVLVYFLKERRKNRAESSVAERTVNSQVAVKDYAAIEAQLVTLRSALDMERQSKDRLIADLSHQLNEATDTIAHQAAELRAMKTKMRELEVRLEECVKGNVA